MIERMKKYPARLQAVIVSAVSLITAFGVAWSAEQVSVVTAFSAAVIALFLEQPGKAA